jgi:predicted ATP-binding protein involved in virulence
VKIERLILENFRGVGKTLELPLEPDLTVLAGINGSGKSTILDALAILLSWVMARTRRAGGSGIPISELSINNSAGYARIRAESRIPEKLYWQLVKTKKGHVQPLGSATELDAVSKYSKSIQEQISDTQEKCNIPLFAYYPVNRAVLDIPLRIRQSHEFGLLEAWDGALAGAASFRHFFEWFRNREDLENEERIWALLDNKREELSPEFIASIEKKIKTSWQEFMRGEGENWTGVTDSQLDAVRNVLQAFLPNFRGFSVRRNPLRMTAQKNAQEIRIDQLSDGEKCLIALVGDLARRLAIANPQLVNSLEGEGIVLIDEVDLHIHPTWQRKILANLNRTFPGCQFVVSTHSPQVLGEAEARQIRLLAQSEDQGFSYSIPMQAKGLNSNEILDELMRPNGNSLSRNQETQEKLDQLFSLIDQDDFSKAKALIVELKQQLHGDIPDIIRAESLIFMLDEDS